MSPHHRTPDDDEFDPPRRSFVVHLLTATISVLVGVVPLIFGGLFFLDPLVRSGRKKRDATGFLRLGITVDSLPADGTPMKLKVVADKVDAWNFYPNVPIGNVWLRRMESGEVLAFNATCPHLGCTIGYRDSEHDFYCPCHTSAFDVDGNRTNDIPPRDMDILETDIDDDGRIAIEFIAYRTGESTKIPL